MRHCFVVAVLLSTGNGASMNAMKYLPGTCLAWIKTFVV